MGSSLNRQSRHKPSFLPVPQHVIGNVEINARQWFRLLIEHETAYPYMENIWQDLHEAFSEIDKLKQNNDVSNWLDKFNLALYLDSNDESPFTVQQIDFVFKQYSPLFKVIGSWLCGITSIPYVWKEDSAYLLKQHIQMMGSGNYQHSITRAFESSALRMDVKIPEECNFYFFNDDTISGYSFVLPAYLMKVAMFPSFFYEETLGVNLAMVHYLEKLSHLSILCNNLLNGLEIAPLLKNALSAIESYLDQQTDRDTHRIWNGYERTIQLIDSFEQNLRVDLYDNTYFNNDAQMIRLLNKIGRYGYGYHKRGSLQGCPIDCFLNPESFNPEQLLDALKDSKYIRKGQQDRSALVHMFTNVNGAMYGICTEDDIQIIRKWISGLNQNEEIPEKRHNVGSISNLNGVSQLRGINPSVLEQARLDTYGKYAHISLQDLYVQLLQVEQNPDILPIAFNYAQKWLKSHQNAQVVQESIPFSVYHHADLSLWFENQHRKQVDSYRPLTEEPEESRDEVIEDAIRLAPLTLIDGAWLRLVSIPSLISTHIGYLHYKTLIDELGQGDTHVHHGNVYRKLLDSMGVKVPSLDNLNTTSLKLFDDDDFLVPVYWLSISLFPKYFFPEILGLNLAMELSGVGGEYRRSSDVLRYYGFDSLFTDLHNTVDNVVTGHSAWALEAIKEYLDDIFQKGGEAERQKHWERIWLGYCSLNIPKKLSFMQKAHYSIKRFFYSTNS
ncbi:iron-containing redox enzyme family protein [Vibrio gazogenes]|uniref:Iron-containing redox enzyme n=1 Tax=Vibrio gazogenes DSM 21264 = NBRC 103151 TaxID=1123492 RepID=A0A1M4YTK7_VIBGA|nr:iron-containing redox enzyme family protein [Vibrio gazogenes]USP15094.1 iron-containing redox enzyme family protein [Vibrio gazogenes]SHF09111.1 Iron-containing redox enzyme [Vibrio gazogenes DSM 21264] [Vibrio gazogenes DSM 21264 = NBRC 103151]